MFLPGIIASLLLLGILAWQDFRSRLISAWLLPLLALAFFFIRHEQFEDVLRGFLINMLVLAFQLFMLTLYFSIRERKLVNIFDTMLGWGDVLFLVCAALLFTPASFIFFFTATLFATVLVTAVTLFIQRKQNSDSQTVPLVSAMSVPLMLMLLMQLLVNRQMLYPGEWFLEWMAS